MQVREIASEARVTLPRVRELECYLNEGALKDLVIEYLHKLTVIKDTEEVTYLTIGPAKDGAHRLYVRYSPDIQTIY